VLRNRNIWQVTCSPRPPTLSHRHMDLHVWSYPRLSYIFQVSSKSVQGFLSPRGSKFAHSHHFGYWLLQQLARWWNARVSGRRSQPPRWRVGAGDGWWRHLRNPVSERPTGSVQSVVSTCGDGSCRTHPVSASVHLHAGADCTRTDRHWR